MLFNATYKELYNHSNGNCSALGGSVCYSDIDIVGEDIPPHGSRLFRLTAAPSLWIPNTGTAAKSIVLNSSGFYPGNEPWKLVDGARQPTFALLLVTLCAFPWVTAKYSVGFWSILRLHWNGVCAGLCCWTRGRCHFCRPSVGETQSAKGSCFLTVENTGGTAAFRLGCRWVSTG